MFLNIEAENNHFRKLTFEFFSPVILSKFLNHRLLLGPLGDTNSLNWQIQMGITFTIFLNPIVDKFVSFLDILELKHLKVIDLFL